MISGSKEYKSDQSLAKYSDHLKKKYGITVEWMQGKDGGNKISNLDALDKTDVLLIYCRRMKIRGDDLKKLKAWCTSGKPIVSLRTGSHAFQTWLALDKEVMGGNYKGHHDDSRTSIILKDKDHPILKGVEPWESEKLYKNQDLGPNTKLLVEGKQGGSTEKLAWTNVYEGTERTGRMFYTSAGTVRDFGDPNFVQMLDNSLFWVKEAAVSASIPAYSPKSSVQILQGFHFFITTNTSTLRINGAKMGSGPVPGPRSFVDPRRLNPGSRKAETMHVPKNFLRIVSRLTIQLFLCTYLCHAAQAFPGNVKLDEVATGFQRPVWAGQVPGKTQYWVVLQQNGSFYKLVPSSGGYEKKDLGKVAAKMGGSVQNGAYSIAFHPDFVRNSLFYITYLKSSGSSVIEEWTLDPGSLQGPEFRRTLLTIPQLKNHASGNLLFGSDGYLYSGQAHHSGDPQNLNWLGGKILRIDVDKKEGGKEYLDSQRQSLGRQERER